MVNCPAARHTSPPGHVTNQSAPSSSTCSCRILLLPSVGVLPSWKRVKRSPSNCGSGACSTRARLGYCTSTKECRYHNALRKGESEMSSRLNSDGAKIRALRIQRGWTQEQLAEIAGVSARTIQRTETGGSAAFDTLRAIAGAFETDFNHLLRSEPSQVPEPVPPFMYLSEQAENQIPESCENATLAPPAQAGPRMRAIFPVASIALAAGLLAGGILVYLFYPPVDLNFSTPFPVPPAAERVGTGEESSHREIGTLEIRRILPTVASADVVATIPGRESGYAAEKPEDPHHPGTTEAIQLADLGPHATIPEPAQSSFLELPLPRNLPPILSAYEMTGRWTTGLPHTGDHAQTDQAAGAVRQSIGQAAKKTSDALAKVSASIRRIF